MFKIGDIVVYGAQGICKISNIEVKQLGKTALDYYVLSPIFNGNTSLFVPVDNEKLTSKMQNTLTKSEVLKLIESAPKIDFIKVQNESTRQEQYREILSGGDRNELLSLIKTLRFERDERSKTGKRLNMSDGQMLHKAEQLLFNEIAFVLGITPNEACEKLNFNCNS